MDATHARLAFLLETVALEAEHLQATDQRLFAEAFTAKRAATLRADAMLAEHLDAFIARFARLQDTAGDKLLPALLARLGEPVASVLDNVDRAARLGLLAQSSETWIAARAQLQGTAAGSQQVQMSGRRTSNTGQGNRLVEADQTAAMPDRQRQQVQVGDLVVSLYA